MSANDDEWHQVSWLRRPSDPPARRTTRFPGGSTTWTPAGGAAADDID